MVAVLRSAGLAVSLALLSRVDALALEDAALAADAECDASVEQCGLSALQRRVSQVALPEDPEAAAENVPPALAAPAEEVPTAEAAPTFEDPTVEAAPAEEDPTAEAAPAAETPAAEAASATEEPKVTVTAAGYAQCGGETWSGATACGKGFKCQAKDAYYAQCVPEGRAKPKVESDDVEESAPFDARKTNGLNANDEDDEDDVDDEDDEDEDDEDAPFDARKIQGRRPNDEEAEDDEDGEKAVVDEDDETAEVDEDDEAGEKQKVGKLGMQLLKPNPPMPDLPSNLTLNPIVIKGNFLYDSVTGKRFFAKGTSYNPRMETFDPNGRSKGKPCESGNAVKEAYTVDVISDTAEERWSEDLKVIENLGANTMRLFNIDAGQDHTKFMKAAEARGIYVIIPLNSKDYGFLPAFPSPDCYSLNMTFPVMNADGSTRPYGNVGTNVLSYGKQIVKQFSKFPNTLFFTVNNEFAMNDKNGFAGFQCVKALTRDIHQYQKACGASMRRVPLIYSDYDMGAPDRGLIAKYLTCALESEDDAIDAYGLNVYSYCENAYPGDGKKDNFNYSPYKDIKKDFKDFSVPVLFTEFGCVEGDFLSFCPYKGGRTWPDVKLFFNDVLGEILSGAIAYTYEQDFEERGMVLTPGFLDNQTDVYLLDNYYALQTEFQAHDVSSKWDGAVTTDCGWTPDKAAKQVDDHHRPQCPSSSAGKSLQKRRRVSKVTDWHELPPAAIAPLSDVNGQAECPSDTVDAAIAKESQCHFQDEA